MGGGRGGGYSSNSDSRVLNNFGTITREFGPAKNGLFGTEGTSKYVREIEHPNPQSAARKFFNVLSTGAEKVWQEAPGKFRAEFSNGTHVIYRTTSNSDGSPAVNFKIPPNLHTSIKTQKIHFVVKAK